MRRDATRTGSAEGGEGSVVEIVRSRRRVRSSSAQVRDGRIVLRLPAHLSAPAAERTCQELLRRLHERAVAPLPDCSLPPRGPARDTRATVSPRGDHGLVARADAVAARWLGDHDARPASVRWSHRMTARWASITLPDRRVRISHRLADAPDVVLDALLLHELAHIVHGGHGAAFRILADRHPDRREVDAWLTRRTQHELRRALGVD